MKISITLFTTATFPPTVLQKAIAEAKYRIGTTGIDTEIGEHGFSFTVVGVPAIGAADAVALISPQFDYQAPGYGFKGDAVGLVNMIKAAQRAITKTLEGISLTVQHQWSAF